MGNTHRELLQIAIRAELRKTLNPFFAQLSEFAKKTHEPVHSKELLLDHVDIALGNIMAELKERLEREKQKVTTKRSEEQPE